MSLIRKILCVTDLSSFSKNAEIISLRLAEKLKAHLTILSCGDFYKHNSNYFLDENIVPSQTEIPYTEEYLKFIEQKKIITLEHIEFMAKKYKIKMPENINYEIRLENEVIAALDIIEESAYSFDLVIVTKQDYNFWERLLFGFPASEIREECKISTLLLPSNEQWSQWLPNGIVVASSLTEDSALAEEYGAELGQKLHGYLSIMHVVDTVNLHFDMNVSHVFPIDYIPSQIQTETIEEVKKNKNNELTKIKQKLVNDFNLTKIKTHLHIGRVGEEILHYINNDSENNLLIIGARKGNALAKFFLGSKTSALEESCLIPILIAQKSHS
jgi:nucleotide-binding universal stress UspA family protein